MCSDIVQDSLSSSQMCVVKFYSMVFLSPSSDLLGSQNIYFTSSLSFSSFIRKKYYFYQTNKGHCCEYSGVVQYNFHLLKRFSLDFI